MVDILCPHCGFSKSLPDEKIPAGVKWANCPRCKNRFELVLRKPVPLDEERQEGPREKPAAERGAPPWESRSELGLWKAIYRTTRAVLFSPRRFFRAMEPHAGLREPFAYGLLTGSLGTMVGFFWQFPAVYESLHALIGEHLDRFGPVLIFMVCMVVSPIGVVVALVLTSLIVHGCLFLVRGGKNGFQSTFRVIAYSQGTQLLAFIPLLGVWAALMWQLIVQMIGLREIHEISYGRIAAAALIPFGLFLLLVMIAVLMLPSLFLR